MHECKCACVHLCACVCSHRQKYSCMCYSILPILSSSPDHPYFQEDTHANVSSWEGLCPSNSTEVCLSMEVCLNHSGPPEECFWNQQSRISGIFCEECEKLCRSWSTSLNFVQFLVGLLPFTLAAPITRITLTILTSDGMGSAGQVSVYLRSWSVEPLNTSFRSCSSTGCNEWVHLVTCWLRRILLLVKCHTVPL